MRLYKFRAWDTNSNEWIDMTHMDIAFKTDATQPGKWYVVTTQDGEPIENRNIVAMMYTDLFDDTGEEICENDICFAFKKGSGLAGYYKVVWDALRGRWAYESNTGIETYQVGKAGNIHCKIIGNIYDKPNLDDIRKLG